MEETSQQPLANSAETFNSPAYIQARVAPILDAIEQMSPGEVLASHRDWKAKDDYYVEAIVALPSHNLDLGRAVYTTFAESQNPADREEIIIHLDALCRADPQAGVRLWSNLLRDPSDGVRVSAYMELENFFETAPGNEARQEETRQDEFGDVTWHDITNLYRTYIKAERNPSTRYQPGVNSGQSGQAPGSE